MKTPVQYASTGSEFSHQVALFMWSNMAARFGMTAANDPKSYSVPGYAQRCLLMQRDAVPELEWLFAIKNAGHGDAIRGARSAAEGVKAGVPDLCLPVPSNSYFGLYVELKRPLAPGKRAGTLGPDQDKWSKRLLASGYQWKLAFGWEAARDEILQYLGRGNG